MRDYRGTSDREQGRLLSGNTVSDLAPSTLKKVKEALIEKAAPHVKLGIFRRRDLGILEALIFQLRKEGLGYSEIGRLISRDPRTVWASNSNAQLKAISEAGPSDLPVPLSIFEDRGVGALEALVGFLAGLGFGYRKIAEELDRNPKTIYTVLRRLEAKGRSVEPMHLNLPDELEAFALALDIPLDEVLETVREFGVHELRVPLALFANRDIGILEALIRYLSEELGLDNAQIAKLLRRSSRNVWTILRNAKAKRIELGSLAGASVPVSVFADRELGPLEALARHLKGKGLNCTEIAESLRRSPKTIWTVLKRSEVRLGT